MGKCADEEVRSAKKKILNRTAQGETTNYKL
jgi:hypothetical protein